MLMRKGVLSLMEPSAMRPRTLVITPKGVSAWPPVATVGHRSGQ